MTAPRNTPAPPTARPVKPKPYQTLDAWRGFAALWVVLSHSCLSTSFLTVSPLVNVHQSFYLFSLAGYLGVQIFFVISGYCIASSAVSALHRTGGLADFLKARARRIYPPYLLSLALVVLASGATAALAHRHPALAVSALARLDFFHRPAAFVLSNLTLTSEPFGQGVAVPVSWTLDYEAAFYGLMGLAMAALIRRRDGFLLLNCLHGLTVVSLAALMLRPLGISYPFDLWPQFGLGVLAYDLLNHPGRAAPRGVAVVVIAQALAFAVLYSRAGPASVFEHWRHSSLPSRVAFALLIWAVLLALRRHDEALSRLRAVRALAWVGRFSYTLYLTHFVCVNALSMVGDRFGVSAATFPLLYLAKVALAVLLAAALYPILEKPFLHRKRARDAP